MTVIDATELRKAYDGVTAIDGLDLTVEEGELFGFLGPNGAGKTTTIGIITGQVTPDNGSISVLGNDPVAEPEKTRERIGIVPERESPPSYLTPEEYFYDLVGEARNIDRDVLEDRVAEWADRLDFEGQLDTIHADLSRGQQQKVMISQAFLDEPDLVIIDEPLANLDPITQETVKDYFQQYQQAGNTLLISTHHIEVAEDICTKVGILSNGELVTEQRPADLEEESLLDVFVTDADSEG